MSSRSTSSSTSGSLWSWPVSPCSESSSAATRRQRLGVSTSSAKSRWPMARWKMLSATDKWSRDSVKESMSTHLRAGGVECDVRAEQPEQCGCARGEFVAVQGKPQTGPVHLVDGDDHRGGAVAVGLQVDAQPGAVACADGADRG